MLAELAVTHRSAPHEFFRSARAATDFPNNEPSATTRPSGSRCRLPLTARETVDSLTARDAASLNRVSGRCARAPFTTRADWYSTAARATEDSMCARESSWRSRSVAVAVVAVRQLDGR